MRVRIALPGKGKFPDTPNGETVSCQYNRYHQHLDFSTKRPTISTPERGICLTQKLSNCTSRRREMHARTSPSQRPRIPYKLSRYAHLAKGKPIAMSLPYPSTQNPRPAPRTPHPPLQGQFKPHAQQATLSSPHQNPIQSPSTRRAKPPLRPCPS